MIRLTSEYVFMFCIASDKVVVRYSNCLKKFWYPTHVMYFPA